MFVMLISSRCFSKLLNLINYYYKPVVNIEKEYMSISCNYKSIFLAAVWPISQINIYSDKFKCMLQKEFDISVTASVFFLLLKL